ncbi:MAG: hypothetical protein ACYC0U_08640 [Ilumatobacteraceae bacterium]
MSVIVIVMQARCNARFGLVDRRMAPAVGTAFSVSGFRQVGERLGEFKGTLLRPEFGQRVELKVLY